MNFSLLKRKLDIGIFPGWAIMSFFSVYSLIKVPKSFLLTLMFLKIGRKFEKERCRMFGKFNITLNVFKKFAFNNSLQESFFTQRSFEGKFFFSDDPLLMHQFYRVSTTHAATFWHFGILFVVSNLYASRVAPFSLLNSQYLHHSEKFVLFDKDNNNDYPISSKVVLQQLQPPSTLKQSIFFRPVVTLLSILRSRGSRWNYDKTIFSKDRDLFWREVKHWISLSRSHPVYKLEDLAWHIEDG